MPARLFVVHGSHPCAAVERALQLKGVPYTAFEWPPPLHAVGMRLLFGPRTVPAIRFEDGEKVSGTRHPGPAGRAGAPAAAVPGRSRCECPRAGGRALGRRGAAAADPPRPVAGDRPPPPGHALLPGGLATA